jgi:hypothetical protein
VCPYPETRHREELGVVGNARGTPWTFASASAAAEWYDEQVRGTLRPIHWEAGQTVSDWHPETRLLVQIVVCDNPWIAHLPLIDAARITVLSSRYHF